MIFNTSYSYFYWLGKQDRKMNVKRKLFGILGRKENYTAYLSGFKKG